MSKTNKDKHAWLERQDGDHLGKVSKTFDGRRYGNKRKAIAELKRKDSRRRNRKDKQKLNDFESYLKTKHGME
jgi:hypothetical protein